MEASRRRLPAWRDTCPARGRALECSRVLQQGSFQPRRHEAAQETAQLLTLLAELEGNSFAKLLAGGRGDPGAGGDLSQQLACFCQARTKLRLLAEMRLFRLWLSAQHLARLKGLSCKASGEGFDSKLVRRFWLPKRQPGLARLVGTFDKAGTCASCSLASAGQPRLCQAVLASLLQLCLQRLPVRRPVLLRIG